MQRREKINFYSDIVAKYHTEVNRFIPGYDEEIVPCVTREVGTVAREGHILDLGSGIGNIDEILIETYQPAQIDLVEISHPMIEASKKRLQDKSSNITFYEISAADFEAKPDSYNSILSNLVIHNLPSEAKIRLIQNIYTWLKQRGTFVWTDLMNFSDTHILDEALDDRKKIALSMGASPDFATQNFKKEREEDHLITIEEMASILQSAGFDEITILWTKFNVVILKAVK